jgi:hypothetical protein
VYKIVESITSHELSLAALVRAIRLPGSFGKAKLEDGGTSDGRVVRDQRIVGCDDSVDGADEIRGDGGGKGAIERSKLGGQTAEEGGVEGSSTGRGGIEGEGNGLAGGGCGGRGQSRESLDWERGVCVGA